jgi:hypothetical protein
VEPSQNFPLAATAVTLQDGGGRQVANLGEGRIDGNQQQGNRGFILGLAEKFERGL